MTDRHAESEQADPRPDARRSRRGPRRATRPGTGGGASGTAADDGDLGWGEPSRDQTPEDAHERWLHDQRPPHWD